MIAVLLSGLCEVKTADTLQEQALSALSLTGCVLSHSQGKGVAQQNEVALVIQGCNSNVHRGVHNLAARATAAYEGARAKVARFINARSDREVVWCRNASEGINLVAYTWGLENLKPGDEVGCGARQVVHWAGSTEPLL